MSRGRVVVTGAAGRVGSSLAPALGGLGWDVVATDIAGEGVLRADCHDVARMAALCGGACGVVHLAGMPDADAGWEAVRRANLDGTRAMLDAARRAGVPRFVLASSIHAVGALPVETPFTPDLPPAPSGLYGVTKLAAEALVTLWARKSPMSGVNVRVCTFAPEPRNARELKTWLAPSDAAHLFDRALRAELPGCVTVWGVSANARAERHDPAADALGYAPAHDAEVHAPRLAAAGHDVTGLGPWRTLGGRMTDETEIGAA